MTAVLGHYGEKTEVCGGEREILPAGRWVEAAIGEEDLLGIRSGCLKDISHVGCLSLMLYAVVCQSDIIVFWPCFGLAGEPASRIEVALAPGVAPQDFLQRFAALCDGSYERLPHRGSDKMPCFHLAPVPPELLDVPALMGTGGACSTEFPSLASIK